MKSFKDKVVHQSPLGRASVEAPPALLTAANPPLNPSPHADAVDGARLGLHDLDVQRVRRKPRARGRRAPSRSPAGLTSGLRHRPIGRWLQRRRYDCRHRGLLLRPQGSRRAKNATDWYTYLVDGRKVPVGQVKLVRNDDATREVILKRRTRSRTWSSPADGLGRVHRSRRADAGRQGGRARGRRRAAEGREPLCAQRQAERAHRGARRQADRDGARCVLQRAVVERAGDRGGASAAAARQGRGGGKHDAAVGGQVRPVRRARCLA